MVGGNRCQAQSLLLVAFGSQRIQSVYTFLTLGHHHRETVKMSKLQVLCGLLSGWERGLIWSIYDLKELIALGPWVFVCTVFMQL